MLDDHCQWMLEREELPNVDSPALGECAVCLPDGAESDVPERVPGLKPMACCPEGASGGCGIAKRE